MVDKFFLLREHQFKKHKVVSKEITLSQAEMKLLVGGVYYAYVRDSISSRQKDYKKLLAKLNNFIHGLRVEKK